MDNKQKQQPAGPAIIVEGLYKSFNIPIDAQNSIKGSLINGFSKAKVKKLDILKNVSFTIEHGEFFGIVGRNGSGKSTLLKLLAGIYTPDKGGVSVIGKLTPFIELGVGFNPELTGKENVYLNGALFGLSRKEMTKLYPKIVDFSELHDFMDQKLKNYSSGMQVRLAFSIAIQSQSDILLFDEVLAVGDESFQRKCFDTFEKYKAEGKTIILVSHDMGSVRRFCSRAMLISEGEVVEAGSPDRISSLYSKLNQDAVDQETQNRNAKIIRSSGLRAAIQDSTGKVRSSYKYGERMTVVVNWPKKFKPKNIGVAIMKNSGEFIYGRNTLGIKHLNLEGRNDFEYEVELKIGPGRYHLAYGLFGETDSQVIEFESKGPSFIVQTDQDQSWGGLVKLNSSWTSKE